MLLIHRFRKTPIWVLRAPINWYDPHELNSFYCIMDCSPAKPAPFNWGWFYFPEGTLEMSGGNWCHNFGRRVARRVLPWHLISREQGCCWTSLNIVLCTKHTQQKIIWPINASSTEVEEFWVDPLFSPCWQMAELESHLLINLWAKKNPIVYSTS